jgi:excisionase family DNA binding protein
MEVNAKKWGTQQEAAEILGVSVNTISRWEREGRIEVRKLGQRVSLDDVRRLLELGEEEYMRERYRKERTHRTK